MGRLKQSKRKRKAIDSSQSAPAKRAKVTPAAPETKGKIPEIINAFERFPERPDNDDRNKEAALYDYLGDEDGEIRNATALAITRGLLGGEGEEPVSDVELERHLERRLFRGLTSGRNASRLGFSIVLTEILSRLFGEADLAETKYNGRFTFAKALSTMNENNASAGRGVSKWVETNYYLGQLFGLECFVKAKIISEDNDRWTQLLSKLLEVGTKKVTLMSPCGWIIVQAVEQLSQSQANETLETIRSANLARTQEGLAVWLAAMDRFPDVRKQPWKEPFSPKSLPSLYATLRDSAAATEDGEENSVKASNWIPQLHFVWDLIVKHFAKLGDDAVGDFLSFWQKVVEDGFFSTKASPQRKFRGLLVFRNMIEGLPQHTSLIKIIFSRNLLSCLMNQTAKKGRYLHNAALKILSSIESTAEAHPQTVVPILSGLLGPNGMYSFDMRTKSKTVAKVLQCTRDEDSEAVLALLKAPLKKTNGLDEEKRESLAIEYVKYLHKLAVAEPRSGSGSGSGSGAKRPLVASSALDTLCSFAYAKPKLLSKYGMSSRTRDFCRVHLEPAFAKAVNSPGGYRQLWSAIAAIDDRAVDMDEEVKVKRDKALENMRILSSDEWPEGDAKVSHSLALLYAVVLFQLYNEDPEAPERLSDLEEFQRRFENEHTDEAATTFLVEALLSMVPLQSPLIRQASQQVFEALAPHLSYEALTLLLEPLTAEENLEGHKQLFAGEDEMEDEGSEDESGEEGESEEESGDESGGESESASDEEVLPDADAEQKAFEDSLAQVLKTHRLDEDADAPSETESDMTDSEMIAIDGQLASAFKGRAAALPPNKKDMQNAKQTVIHFKLRVLDLVAAYLCSEDKSSLIGFRILPDLVRLAATTSSQGVATRVSEVIFAFKTHFNKKEKERWSSSSTDEECMRALAVLQQIHGDVVEVGAPSQAFAKTASTACLLLLSALYCKESRKRYIEKARQMYEATGEAETKVHRSFGDGWVNWCQSMSIKK